MLESGNSFAWRRQFKWKAFGEQLTCSDRYVYSCKLAPAEHVHCKPKYVGSSELFVILGRFPVVFGAGLYRILV